MKKLISKAPWTTKIASAIIALMVPASLPYVIVSFKLTLSLKIWLLIIISEFLYIAIAYALLRQINWVRVLWSIWVVGWFLIAIVPEILAIVAHKKHSIWTLSASLDKLVTVVLLYLPASNKFFGARQSLDQPLEVTLLKTEE